MENKLSFSRYDSFLTTNSNPNDENFLKSAIIYNLDIKAKIRYDTLQKKIYANRKMDLRKRINETLKFPYSAIGALFIKFQGDFWLGSGCLISEYAVLTAAHNIFVKNEFEGSDIEFYPGLNDDQTVIVKIKSKVKKIFLPDEIVEENNPSEDYAVIILEEPLGKYFGYFGISVFEKNFQIETLKNKFDFYLYAYPGDKIREKPGNYQLWGMKLENLYIGNDGYIRYQVDSYSGMSGAGVWYLDNSKEEKINHFLIGIHVMHNHKTREGMAVHLNTKRFKKIYEWINSLKN